MHWCFYSIPSGNMIVCGQNAFSSSSSILVFTDLAESTDPVFEREDLIRWLVRLSKDFLRVFISARVLIVSPTIFLESALSRDTNITYRSWLCLPKSNIKISIKFKSHRQNRVKHTCKNLPITPIIGILVTLSLATGTDLLYTIPIISIIVEWGTDIKIAASSYEHWNHFFVKT